VTGGQGAPGCQPAAGRRRIEGFTVRNDIPRCETRAALPGDARGKVLLAALGPADLSGTPYVNTRPEMPPGVTTLPARFYTDPDHFRLEMERIHFDMWLCAGRTEQLAAPGRYFLRQVGNASVVVLAGERGEVSAFYNVCRHRGTRLCNSEEGQLPGRIQCPYHAWTYGLDGRLRSAPHMEKVAGFSEADYPLQAVATAVWDGHVFINLSERPGPFTEHLAGLPAKFAPWGMADLRRVERRRHELRANWKLVIQNYSECLHCPIVHPLLQRQSHYMSGDNEPPQPTYLGGRMDLREGIQTLSMDGQTTHACLPGLGPAEQRHVYYYAILPNLLLNLHPDYMLTYTIWPRGVDRTDVLCEWHFHPTEIARPDFDAKSAIEFWDLTNRQDWELSELAQEGISSRGYRPGPYSNREELLRGLDRFVLERTGAAGPGSARPPA
jgi:Rieske 2Fe-2S family protein